MDKAWIKIIKVTGSVGVVGLLLSLLMNHMFNEQIIGILGSEKFFFILVLIVCGLFIAMIIAIKSPKSAPPSTKAESQSEPSKKIDITYNSGSTHNGDNNF
jgi:hypothetical protein